MPKPLSPTQQRVLELLEETGGNQTRVAEILGIRNTTINKHVRTIRAKGYEVYTIPHGASAKYMPAAYRNPEEQKLRMKALALKDQNLNGVSTLYDREGEIVGQWVKTGANKQTAEEIYELAIEAFKEQVPKAKPVDAPTRKLQPELLNLFIITDFHLGMKAWHEETRDADWDIKIAEKLLVDWFGAAIKAAPNAETAVLAQLGDFLHWDGMEAVTPASGHILDADTRFQKVVRVAIRALRRVIQMLLSRHATVRIIMAEGNHDPASSIWLREMFAAFYENEPRVHIDLSPDPYYCVEHGATSLFFHHGHKRKPSNIDDVFVAKFRDVFGRTKFSYGHMGHLHNAELRETNLMVVEQHRTLASPDAYASRGGWMSGRDAKCITYSEQFGEVGRVVITPDMVKNEG